MSSNESWVQEYMPMIESCEEHEGELNDWERKFIDDIRIRLEAETPLSINQANKLEEIYLRITR